MSSHNLIVLSDVHLGSDIVQHARPDAPVRARASARRDADLVALLDWYRDRREGECPWRLVIAGDFVDFVGMSVSPDVKGIRTEPSVDERELGLGGAVDHAVFKLRQVAQHHRDVFRALAEFIAAGNALVVVRGNHDVDFHWRPVQDEFLRQLALWAPVERGRLEFSPWFYYEEGRIYVEHGHQYDRYCAHEHWLHPVCPRDHRRSWQTLSDIMLRYVVRPTRGMIEAGHDRAGLFDYLRFAARLGASGMLELGWRFLRAVLALLSHWRGHFSEGARRIRHHHERRMAELAVMTNVSLERLRALASLQPPPVTRSLAHIFATVMLDRILLLLAAVLCAVLASTVSEHWLTALIGGGGAAVVLALVGLAWSRMRAGINASAELRERAARVTSVLPAAFVVMGHTHLPEVRAFCQQGTYVNLGAWAEDDPEDGGVPVLPATRTHLVVSHTSDQTVGELRVWDSELGPQRFAPGYAPRTDGPL